MERESLLTLAELQEIEKNGSEIDISFDLKGSSFFILKKMKYIPLKTVITYVELRPGISYIPVSNTDGTYTFKAFLSLATLNKTVILSKEILTAS